jgi:hypothetical protein
MSQDWTDSIPDASNQWEQDIIYMRQNFAVLKSCFSGDTAPANPVAGMPWADTTTNILKIRDKDNNTWYSIFDLANNKPILSNLSGDITGAMIASAIKDPSAATPGLRTLGTGALQACPGNDSRLSDARIPTDASVSQSKLKTSSGAVSLTPSSRSDITYSVLTLPGGEYGFYPRIQIADSVGRDFEDDITLFRRPYTGSYLGSVSAGCYVTLGCRGDSNVTQYAYQRYVTSSGEVFWLFVLRDKKTKQIIATYSAPEHPCFGNGGKPLLVAHPFASYNPQAQEIIVVNPSKSELKELESKMIVADEAKPDLSLAEVINTLYEIDEKAGSPDWPRKAVTVGLPSGHDWTRTADGTPVTAIKKQIPKMDYFITRTLRLK